MIQRQIYAQVATDTISLNIHKHRSINPENFSSKQCISTMLCFTDNAEVECNDALWHYFQSFVSVKERPKFGIKRECYSAEYLYFYKHTHIYISIPFMKGV